MSSASSSSQLLTQTVVPTYFQTLTHFMMFTPTFYLLIFVKHAEITSIFKMNPANAKACPSNLSLPTTHSGFCCQSFTKTVSYRSLMAVGLVSSFHLARQARHAPSVAYPLCFSSQFTCDHPGKNSCVYSNVVSPQILLTAEPSSTPVLLHLN